MSDKRIVVVGDVMLDVVVRPTKDVAPTSDTPADVVIGRGGSGANVAVAIAAAGHDVTYVGSGGDDAASELFVRALESANVRAALQKSTGRTGTVVAMIASDGQRAMLTDRGVNAMLTESSVAASIAPDVDHVHLSGYVFLDPGTRSVGVNALRDALRAGTSVSVDVCSLAPLQIMTPALFLNCAKGASYLFANEEEAIALTETANVDDAIGALSELFDEVVVTRGANGAVAQRGDERVDAKSSASVALDTTGAGDAATGAYLGARLRGSTIEESLHEAMAAAAIVVSGLGATKK